MGAEGGVGERKVKWTYGRFVFVVVFAMGPVEDLVLATQGIYFLEKGLVLASKLRDILQNGPQLLLGGIVR